LIQVFEIIGNNLAIHFVMEVAFIIIIYIIEEFFKTEIFNTIFKKSERLRQDKLIFCISTMYVV